MLGHASGALCHAKGPLCWHRVTGQGRAPEEGGREEGQAVPRRRGTMVRRLMVFNPLNPGGPPGPGLVPKAAGSRAGPARNGRRPCFPGAWHCARCPCGLLEPWTQRRARERGGRCKSRGGSGRPRPRAALGGAGPFPRRPRGPRVPAGPGVFVWGTRSSVEPGRRGVVKCGRGRVGASSLHPVSLQRAGGSRPRTWAPGDSLAGV